MMILTTKPTSSKDEDAQSTKMNVYTNHNLKSGGPDVKACPVSHFYEIPLDKSTFDLDNDRKKQYFFKSRWTRLTRAHST